MSHFFSSSNAPQVNSVSIENTEPLIKGVAGKVAFKNKMADPVAKPIKNCKSTYPENF
jgi:hypothetical protein